MPFVKAKKIRCDADGVLVDCLRPALKFHGRFDLANDPNYPPTYYWEKDTGLDHKEFWNLIDAAGPEWWDQLPWTMFGKKLLAVLIATGHQISIATKVVGANGCAGKYTWAKRELPEGMPLHMTTGKTDLAEPGSLLIDDCEANTDAWVAAGGDAILVPATYNRNRNLTIPALDYIIRELKGLGYMTVESNEGHVIAAVQNVLRTLPQDSADRKAAPILSGVIDYFPLAMAAVARVSRAGNDQHNPGQPLHWARGKSADHADCIVRHLVERGTIDTDGQRHTAKVVWRALALLQEELEAEAGWTPESTSDYLERIATKAA